MSRGAVRGRLSSSRAADRSGHALSWAVGRSGLSSGRTDRPALSEVQIVCLAAGVWIAALAAVPIPLIPSAMAAVGLFLVRHRLLFIVAVLLLAGAVGHRADEQFRPRDPELFEGPVTVLAEARPFGVGWRAVVRLPDGDRVEASGFGLNGFELRRAGGGTTLQVKGRISPVDDTPWARSRHLVGRLALSAVDGRDAPGGVRGRVEAIRSTVVAGAEPIGDELEPLYLGLVIGEDRLQAPAQRARFRAAGLSHLLAVSGQNVAFVLAVMRPFSRLLGVRGRMLFTLGLLAVFATATRFEPSVLRATVTAGLAAHTALSGHERDGVRMLSLAVTALILVDPFLVHSVGFQLSVAASAGIVVVGPLLVARVPGPAVVGEPVAVTMAAQLAVLPLQLHYFGPVSAASIPANVLAGWAAGFVMTWGLSVGVIAGFAPEPVGAWLQAPATLALVWLDSVAAWAVRMPAPRVSAGGALIVAGILVLWWVVRVRDSQEGTVRKVVVAALVVTLATVSLIAVPRPPEDSLDLVGGGQWIPGDGANPSVLVIAADADVRLLDELTAQRLHHIDVIVSQVGVGSAALVAAAAADLVGHEVLLAPPQHRIVGAHRVPEVVAIDTSIGLIVLEPEGSRMSVVYHRATVRPG